MKTLFWVFPILFLIDNVLGLNGYQFTVFGVGIRIILFALNMGSLCLHCLYTAKKEHISLWKRVPGRLHICDLLCPLDGIVAGFLLLNAIWATVIPMLKGTSFSYAINDFTTVLVLVLYFPCAFLIRTKQLDMGSLYKWLYPLLLLLALWHSVMYVGEILSPGFYLSYYDFIDIISFGTAVRTDVVLGFGITRIIQVTSILLIPAMLLTLEKTAGKLQIATFGALALTLFAVLITYTKSIWYGVLAGLAVAMVGICLFTKENAVRKRILAFCGALVLLFGVFNFGFLDNTVISRAFNGSKTNTLSSLDTQIADLQMQLDEIQAGDSTDTTDPSVSSDAESLSEQLKKLQSQRQDISGTAEANAQRAEQQNALLEKWSESKLLGFGYGAYAEDCIRNESFPFMYESLIPALIMKLGLLGMLGWGVFVLALVVFAVKRLWKQPVRFWCWIGTALAYAMAVQTNPFLFTFAGMSLMLYLLLPIAEAKEDMVL